MDRYKSDWSKILQKYEETCKGNIDVNAGELFSLYNWLMWAPSVHLHCKHEEYKLGEYGMGDEAMALPMVLTNTKKANILWDETLELMDQNRIGRFMQGIFKIYQIDSYMDRNSSMFGAQITPFCEFLRKQQEKSSFVLELNDYVINQKVEGGEYIFSAYIWLLLHFVENDDVDKFNHIHTSAWFEHANIADADNAKFLKERLIDKVIKHLENIWNNHHYDKRKYSVVWGLSDSIVTALQDEVCRLIEQDNYPYREQMKNRLSFNSRFCIFQSS
jgi:hypothetical protein